MTLEPINTYNGRMIRSYRMVTIKPICHNGMCDKKGVKSPINGRTKTEIKYFGLMYPDKENANINVENPVKAPTPGPYARLVNTVANVQSSKPI